MKLSVVIPAHNEEDRIGAMLDAYLPFFSERYTDDVEFIVVVNGSTDATDKVVAAYTGSYPQVRLIVEPGRIGKGGAVIRGFTASSGDLVGYVDADGSTPPAAFQELVETADSHSVVIASRWRRESELDPPQSLIRRLASRIFNLATRVLFGLRLTDTQCGAKVMRREVLDRILPRIGITNWAFDIDLLFQVRRAGFRITELPTTWHDVEGSKIAVTEASIEMVAALVRLRLLYSPFKGLVYLYDRFLGPILTPAGVERDHLIRHSLLVMGASQANNIISLLLQIAMVRALSSHDYGIMAAMLSMIGLFRVPLQAVGATVLHFTSVHIRQADWGVVRAMARLAIRDLTVVGALMLVVLALLAERVVAAFSLGSHWPVIAVLLILVGSLYAPIIGGVLMGAQRFGTSAIVSFSACILNLVVAVALVLSGAGALGPLLGNAASVWFAAVIGGLIVYRMIPKVPRSTTPVLAGAYRYFARYLVGSFCLLFLMTGDVLFAKYFLSSTEAGHFAKAAAVARMVVMMPVPIFAAMVPKVASAGSNSEAARGTQRKAMLLAMGLSVSVALLIVCFPRAIFLIFRRNPEIEIVRLVRPLALVYLPLIGVYSVASFEFAQRRFRLVAPLACASAVYFSGSVLFHQSASDLVAVYGCANWLALGLCLADLRLTRPRQTPLGSD